MSPEINPSPVFSRPHLAAELADRLLRPGVLDGGFRSGLVLSGPRHTGKTTFLRTDLVRELVRELVRSAVRQTLRQLETPTSPLLSRLREAWIWAPWPFALGSSWSGSGNAAPGPWPRPSRSWWIRAAAAYGEAIGREVRVEESQPVVNERLAPMC